MTTGAIIFIVILISVIVFVIAGYFLLDGDLLNTLKPINNNPTNPYNNNNNNNNHGFYDRPYNYFDSHYLQL